MRPLGYFVWNTLPRTTVWQLLISEEEEKMIQCNDFGHGEAFVAPPLTPLGVNQVYNQITVQRTLKASSC